MADLALIRQALAAQLAAVTGTQVSAYMLSAPTPPCIHVFPGGPAGDFEYHQALGGGVELWPFTIQAFVPDTSDIGAQKNLDAYIQSTGAKSVKAGLETRAAGDDTVTLGGLIHDLIVVSCTPYQRFVFEGQRAPCIGAEWHVNVYVIGN